MTSSDVLRKVEAFYHEHPGTTYEHAAAVLGVAKSTVHGAVAELAEAGILVRAVCKECSCPIWQHERIAPT